MLEEYIRKSQELFYSVRRGDKQLIWGSLDVSAPEGWCIVGRGNFSRVYRHRGFPQFVTKISCSSHWGDGEPRRMRDSVYDDAGPALDAWPVFADFCKHNWETSEHLPRVYHLERVSRGVSWGVVESLEPAFNSSAAYTHRTSWAGQLGGDDWAEQWLLPVVSMAQELGLRVDLHGENVMLRGNTPVLTDPFSFIDTQ